MTLLLIAEHDTNQITDATRRALTAACEFGTPIHVLVAGNGCLAAAQDASRLRGVQKVLLADSPDLKQMLAEPTALLISDLAGDYQTIIAASSAAGKNVMPRVAALLDVQIITEVIKIVAHDTFERPIFAGNAIQTVQSEDPKKVLTIRTAGYLPVPSTGEAPIEAITFSGVPARSRFMNEQITMSERPDLGSARIVVSGGRALGSAANFTSVIGPLADYLGAAIGASRAAVDAGYAPNDLQVGQTGRIVAPDLYIAAGISGAIQHLAGMKDSKIIVAINKDEEAPIFQIADFGLVGDLFEIIPALVDEIDRAK